MRVPKISYFLRLFKTSMALAACKEPRESLAVGGQAVMEGIMMRNGSHLALAVRKPDGSIVAMRRQWVTIFKGSFIRKKWIRGFPTLVETMINGIKALNLSAEIAGEAEGEEIKPWHLVLTLAVALVLAFAVFVVIPHLLTLLLEWFSLVSGVEGFSFHVLDGIIKFLIFVGYISLISRLPDIRRVFEYHGAEHKTIAAYEAGNNPVTPEVAKKYSKLHPRCGTTFLLFVLVISIMVHTILVPASLLVWTPQSAILKHVLILLFKLFLIIPIGALAYEAIRWAAQIDSGLMGTIIRTPGLMLQRLTTREPDIHELEVGLIALKEALAAEAAAEIITPDYTILEQK